MSDVVSPIVPKMVEGYAVSCCSCGYPIVLSDDSGGGMSRYEIFLEEKDAIQHAKDIGVEGIMKVRFQILIPKTSQNTA